MRASLRISFLNASALVVAVALACSSGPAPQPALPESERSLIAGRAGLFSAERAWSHLEALAAIGSRAVGTAGSREARDYIREQLEQLELAVESSEVTISFTSTDHAPIELVNLEATIPGGSADLIVLAAPYDSAFHESFRYLGVNDGASGAALLLELARVLVLAPLPYSVRLYFLDGEAALGRGDPEDVELHLLGSTAVADRLKMRRQFEKIRLLLLFNRVSDADLRIGRDRFSHRTYRDAVWRAAAQLGHEDVFPPASDYEAPLAGHRSFIDRGMRRTVAIVDSHFGDPESPQLGGDTEDDTLERSSPQSLEVVGRVTLSALESISARLTKIDRYSEVPLVVEPEPSAQPQAEAPEAQGDSAAPTGEAVEPESSAQPQADAPEAPGDSAVPVGEASEPDAAPPDPS